MTCQKWLNHQKQSYLPVMSSLLFRTINNQADSVLLQNDLTSLQDWEDKWQMSSNAMPSHSNNT
jgi:hypothetical protein